MKVHLIYTTRKSTTIDTVKMPANTTHSDIVKLFQEHFGVKYNDNCFYTIEK
jgi:hypothetical protein